LLCRKLCTTKNQEFWLIFKNTSLTGNQEHSPLIKTFLIKNQEYSTICNKLHPNTKRFPTKANWVRINSVLLIECNLKYYKTAYSFSSNIPHNYTSPLALWDLTPHLRRITVLWKDIREQFSLFCKYIYPWKDWL